MKIAIDVSPLTTGHYLAHRVRGTGFYLTNLKDALLKYFPENEYVFFKRGDKLSSNIDIIHYPYFEPYFITLPHFGLSKSTVTVHDLTPLVFKSHFPAGIKGNAKWQIQKRSLKKAGAIITDSESSKKDIIEYVGVDSAKVNVVYLSAADHFKPKPDSEKNKIIKKFSLPENFALYVGDATWNKNLPGLIEAFNQTDYFLVIVGKAFENKNFDKDNPWNQSLKKAQDLAEKNKRIITLGFVSDEDLASLYNAALLFTMPSFYEGFGLPVLEAMQSGCPVVISDKGSLKEIAGEAAVYVDPYEADSIKKGIEKLMSDSSLRKKLSEKGIERAKKFSWRETAINTVEVYKKIARIS